MGNRTVDVVVGIDGGGTKTRAVVVALDGRLLGEALGPSSNFQMLGPEKTAAVLHGCVREALERVSGGQVRVRCVSACLAGVGRPSDRRQALQALQALEIAPHYRVESDAMGALAGAFAGGEGIILIAGTGTICLGKGADGRVERAGGWGYLLGDEGSGYYIGQQAIVGALKDLDGRGPTTRLRSFLEARYELERIDRIIPKIYQGEIDRTEIAAIAPHVFEIAANGDEVAMEIIRRAAEELAKLAVAVGRRLAWSTGVAQIAPIGSLFRQFDVLQPHMERVFQQEAFAHRFVEPLFDPAIGAAILGLEEEGVRIEDSVLRNLRSSAR
ncbi:MAG: hypothetical protein ONB23_11845 [candidate division KSB1 bacterium]|nr:hypothetical protein [candidate division KSB1 bacterium]